MNRGIRRYYEFGPFRIDVRDQRLLCEGQPVPLPPKVFDTLLALVESSGRVLMKEELMGRVWPDTFVEEANLTVNISVLRKALGGASPERQYVETIPRRGYRFVPDVREVSEEVAGPMRQPPEALPERPPTAPPPQAVTTGAESVSPPFPSGAGPAAEGGWPEARKEAPGPSPLRPPRRRPKWGRAALCILLAGLAAAAAYRWLPLWPESARPDQPVRSIAVLPFKPLDGGGDVYLEAGMADALITRLSRISQLAVRPTHAVLKYAAPQQDPLAAGRELGVDSVLYGHVQTSADRIRVTVQLVRSSDGVTLWAETFDDRLDNIFSAQDSVSEKVAEALLLKLSLEQRRLLALRSPESGEAYRAYLRGRYHWAKWTAPEVRKAIGHFQQALDIDPAYAPAYSGLADSYELLGYLGAAPPHEVYPKAEAATAKALEIDGLLAEAHLVRAKIRLFYHWDLTGADEGIRRALAISPNSADGHNLYGAYLTAAGRFDEAVGERRLALELDPLSAFAHTAVGWAFFYARRFDQAAAWYRRASDLDPAFSTAHFSLGESLEQMGLHAEAVDAYLRAKSLRGEQPETIAELRRAYAESGMVGYWRKELALLNPRPGEGQVGALRVAKIYARLGEKGRALEWLDKAFEERSSELIFLNVDPTYDGLRAEPRFAGLLRRLGLA